MRLGPNQREFVEALFARHDINAPEGHPVGPPSALLAALSRDDFLDTLDRACREAEEAARCVRLLTMWAVRILPYLERDPTLTVDQAVEAYLQYRQGVRD